MRQLNFVKPAAMAFGQFYVTDHNRAPVEITVERLESRVRTQGGDMRKYYRADKRTFSASWTLVPENNNHTVDAAMGAGEVRDFYFDNPDEFTLTLSYDNGDVEQFTVVFTDFSLTLARRQGQVDLYDMSVTLEEV